jgi:hypothetical protein
LAKFCHICLKGKGEKKMDALSLCQKCYDDVLNEIDSRWNLKGKHSSRFWDNP